MNWPQPLPATWDLDVFFSGGSASVDFAMFLKTLEQEIGQFGNEIRNQADMRLTEVSLTALTDKLQSIQARLAEADSFVNCLAAANQHDKKAIALGSSIRSLNARFESELTWFDRMLASVPDKQWSGWMRQENRLPIAFPLTERRNRALEMMSPEQESLLMDLAVDGYHGWSELYDVAVGNMEVPVEDEDGKNIVLSVAQAQNKLHHPSKAVRDRVFFAWEGAWEKNADFCAQSLNHLGGFRLQMYKHRGWDSVLKEPLDMNRMRPETLEAMWDAVERGRSFLLDYFKKKAELVGVKQLGWTDVDAPIGASGGGNIPFDDAARLIVDQFRQFGPKLADFAEDAFRSRWIEAEDRADKRPGGFCTSFPLRKESRIFMTYDGSMANVSTLAHELGHAFHSHVMFHQPQLTQHYAMNVAETASTMAEWIVSDAAVQAAVGREQKLALLDDKIQRSVAFLMNIHARFLFETSFYEERKRGVVEVDHLNALMEEAQRKAYHGALASYHPHFWASKLHFYITEVPFYHFPYTFGYLFSSGMYEIASGEGAAFEERYIALLQDTGRMTVEELARKHLGADITKTEFWERSIAHIRKDVGEFLAL